MKGEAPEDDGTTGTEHLALIWVERTRACGSTWVCAWVQVRVQDRAVLELSGEASAKEVRYAFGDVLQRELHAAGDVVSHSVDEWRPVV